MKINIFQFDVSCTLVDLTEIFFETFLFPPSLTARFILVKGGYFSFDHLGS